MNISECIACPKCQKQFMKKSLHPTFGKEYFCHYCHLEFGINELVNQWNYDAGDFHITSNAGVVDWKTLGVVSRAVLDRDLGRQKFCSRCGQLLGSFPCLCPKVEKLVATVWWGGDTVSPIDEPQFKSVKERDEVYEMVDRMFHNMPEWDEEGCSNKGIDIGLEGYPV
jgi:hypothetical protein